MATVQVFSPVGVAVTPDGKRSYVANSGGPVAVIDTATNMVVANVPVGLSALDVAITPDGKHAYVTNVLSNNVSVIATVTNTVEATIPVGVNPAGVAIAPDGKHAYVANQASGTVSVIDTATNVVVATIPVRGVFGGIPGAVGIVPPPPGIPFSAFSAKLEIDSDRNPNEDGFFLDSSFTLGSASNGIHPDTEKVKLEIGTFTANIPPGSFKGKGLGPFTFQGVINGAALEVTIEPTATKRFALEAAALDANLKGTKNTVPVTLVIGDDSGITSVNADID